MKRYIVSIALLVGSAAPALADDMPNNDPTVGQKVDRATTDTKRAVTDSWITTKVKEQFMADSMVKGRNIHVTTKHHEVILKGKVQSTDEQDRAISLARNVDGVADVVNHLQIKPAA